MTTSFSSIVSVNSMIFGACFGRLLVRMHEGRRDQLDLLARQLEIVGGERGCGQREGEKGCAEHAVLRVNMTSSPSGAVDRWHDGAPMRQGSSLRCDKFGRRSRLGTCTGRGKLRRRAGDAAEHSLEFAPDKEAWLRKAHACRPEWRHACRLALTILVDDVMDAGRRRSACSWISGWAASAARSRRFTRSTTPAANTASIETSSWPPCGRRRRGHGLNEDDPSLPASVFGQHEQLVRIAQHDALPAALDQALLLPGAQGAAHRVQRGAGHFGDVLPADRKIDLDAVLDLAAGLLGQPQAARARRAARPVRSTFR